MIEKMKKMSKNKLNLYVDIGIFLFFALVSAPQATGIAFHEWISFVFVVPIIVHVLLHWRWIVKVTSRLFKKLPAETRFNHLWDLLLFIDMVLVTFSGIVISEAALPALGIAVVVDPFWSAMHDITANLFLVMMGVHLAMHWSWLVTMFKRYIWRKPAISKGMGQQKSLPAVGGD